MHELTKNYNIHDFVKFRIISNKHDHIRYTKLLPTEYDFYRTDDIKPDFEIIIGDFIPDNSECIILDNKYYIKDHYLYCKEKYKSAEWSVEIQGLDTEKMIVKVSYNLPGSLLITDFVINFLINITLNRKGISIIHGSAIQNNSKKAFLFSAQGGAGKTSIAINALDTNYQYLGDDTVIVFEDKVYNFIRPLNIFSYNYSPKIRKNMPYKKQIELFFKNLLKYIGINLVTKVDPRQLFPESIGRSGGLSKLFILIPRIETEIQVISKKDALNFILYNQKLDGIPYEKYIQMYGFAFPDSSVAAFWQNYYRNLDQNLDENSIQFYLANVPQKYNNAVFHKIAKVIESE